MPSVIEYRHDDDCRVVLCSLFERSLDQEFRQIIRVSVSKKLLNGRIIQGIGQAIATEQEEITGPNHSAAGVRLHWSVVPHRLRQNVLMGDDSRQLRRQATCINFLLNHRVIAGQALQLLITVEVNSTVAHMTEVGHIILDEQDHQRGPHAPAVAADGLFGASQENGALTDDTNSTRFQRLGQDCLDWLKRKVENRKNLPHQLLPLLLFSGKMQE